MENNYFEVGAIYECEGVSYTLNKNNVADMELYFDLLEEGTKPLEALKIACDNLMYYLWNNDEKEITFEGTKEEVLREMKFLGMGKVF